jgi:hypothetical protein
MVTALQLTFDVTALVHKHPAQPKPGCAALAEAQLNQAALAGKDLDRKLPAVFAGHGAFDAFNDG